MCSSNMLNSTQMLFSIVFHCGMIAVGRTTVTVMSKDFQLITSLITFRENTFFFFLAKQV